MCSNGLDDFRTEDIADYLEAYVYIHELDADELKTAFNGMVTKCLKS